VDVSFINPFLLSIKETFTTMLSMDVTALKPELKKFAVHSFDVSGVIGLSGEAQGVISLSFQKIVALKVVSALIGDDLKVVGPELIDGIGEMVNIVAGNAKQHLTKYKLSISLPNVIIGKDHRIEVPEGVPTVIIPFDCKFGKFALEVALKTK